MSYSLYKVTFNVPCRQFFVSLTVTKDDRLPMAREFFLRYLFVLREASIDSLQKFFGFNSHQVEVLITELKAAGLLEYVGESLRLSGKAKEMFERAGGADARFITTEEWGESFAIDFISFRILKRVALADTIYRHVPLVASDREKIKRSRQIAEEVFTDGFQEFLQRCKPTISDEERGEYSIYGIHSIRPKGLFDFPLEVDYLFEGGSAGDVVRRYGIFETDADQERRSELISRIAQESDRLVALSSVPSEVPQEVTRLFRGSWLGEVVASGVPDLGAIAKKIEAGASLFDDGDSVAILGGLSIPVNQESISGLLRDAVGERRSDCNERIPLTGDAIWIKPCNELAYRHSDSLSLFRNIRSHVSGFSDKKCNLYVMLNSGYEAVSKFTRSARHKNRTNVFDGMIGSKAGNASHCVEGIIIPGWLVAFSIYIKPNKGSLPVCFGMVSINQVRVAEFSEFVVREWQGFGRKVQGLALRKGFESPFTKGDPRVADLLCLSDLSRSRKGSGGRQILTLKKDPNKS